MFTVTFHLEVEKGSEHFLANVLGYISGVRHVVIGTGEVVTRVDYMLQRDRSLMKNLLRNLSHVLSVKDSF